MRTNLPVTGIEYPFPRGKTLVSTTDAKGRILYCNSSFIEVSGYAKEALLGQPHNLIRHPDMPEEAFRDMWATIAAGKPWSAPVKNRRANGDFYWVMANVTPILDNGAAVGYMSVRTEATRAQIDAAEKLYAVMREEARSGRMTHYLRNGVLVTKGFTGQLRRLGNLNLSQKLLGLSTAGIGMGYALGAGLHDGGLRWVGLGALAIVVAAAWQLKTALMAKPLHAVIHAANLLAGGDLTAVVEHTRTDELGELQKALGQLSVNLRSVVRDARENSGAVVQATNEIVQGNLDLSQRTESQASSLEETAAAMDEITGTVRSTADAAAQVSELAKDVLSSAERSNQAVEAVSSSMAAIHEASSRITEITALIDSIAFQTNILALNAAVEAARAGTQGRGFAVVAGEVRNLAKRSADAAKEIHALTAGALARVKEGQQTAADASQAMQAAVTGVRRVHDFVDEISVAAREQLTGISQVNDAIGHMDRITQQNAAMVEEVTAGAQDLATLAVSARETVQVFKLEEGSHGFGQRADAVALRRANKHAAPAPAPAPAAENLAPRRESKQSAVTEEEWSAF
ncbi:PAS domain-containing methyl-accepting chemotaxis protein [Burkholderia ubonensis]|uniref:methyl-accepting chemotaxis protein n=1 Tax=Burkholderia ubonensis TaxID=101571 RepID=UPI0007533A85|nr:PAS domain-containing methyl-accepting chemotaxis protein [Burkholderia ubonensis]KVP17245.1 chemotaxis protein [Burkholderia ubonensis]